MVDFTPLNLQNINLNNKQFNESSPQDNAENEEHSVKYFAWHCLLLHLSKI